MPRTAGHSKSERIAALDWPRIESELNERGYATTGQILSVDQCSELASIYADDSAFRSQVVMARHGFGRGEYKYFRYPLPEIIKDLRTSFYPRLAGVANSWEEALERKISYPAEHSTYLKKCHAAGQTRPTPLLLKYGVGDYNCLHQDLYGDLFFPLQVAFLLSEPGTDFTGGEFVLVEQRPRMQSRAEVVSLRQGEGVIFAVNQRPVHGSRGYYRVAMRHGQPVALGRAVHVGNYLPRCEVATEEVATGKAQPFSQDLLFPFRWRPNGRRMG